MIGSPSSGPRHWWITLVVHNLIHTPLWSWFLCRLHLGQQMALARFACRQIFVAAEAGLILGCYRPELMLLRSDSGLLDSSLVWPLL